MLFEKDTTNDDLRADSTWISKANKLPLDDLFECADMFLAVLARLDKNLVVDKKYGYRLNMPNMFSYIFGIA
jgi:hypothetical protein